MISLINAIAGFLIPIRITSRLYLADQLKRFGVDVDKMPEPCLQELANSAVETAKTVAAMTRRSWRGIVTDHLLGEAVNISQIIDGSYRPNDPFGAYAEGIKSTLKKYGVSYKTL